MGNSKSSQQDPERIFVNHPCFGHVQLVTHDKQKYIKIRMLVDSEKTIKLWEDTQNLVKDIDQEPLLLPVDHQFVNEGICGATGVLQIVYENYHVILRDEIQNRRETGQHFEESQIWYLLHVLISSAAEFHKRQKKVGDIRPHNIFINEDGQVKVANICSWPRDENNYFKSLNEKQETYLAPEEMSQLQNNVAAPEIDPTKGESFSIGLTLLDAVCLEDCSKLYNFKNCTFNASKLQALILKLNAQKIYSPFLKQIILELLEVDPNLRKSPEQIYQKILPYEYNIKNLIAFTPIRNIPQITGAKIISSTYHSPVNATLGYPGQVFQPFAPQPQIYTQSVYEPRNTVPLPPTTTSHLPAMMASLPSHPIVSANRITYPVRTIVTQNPITYAPTRIVSNVAEVVNTSPPARFEAVSQLPTAKNSNETDNVSTHLPGNQAMKSKQQLWDEIDRQIERSRQMYQ